MNELALFAGAGGGILGTTLLGWRVIAAVEKEPFCREVLLRRQRDGVLPLFPIWDDIRTFDGRQFRETVDVVTAGFPCQPFSCAGKRLGEKDDRNMWPDTIRVIREVGPQYALLENIPGLLQTDYFGQILGDLAEAGFDARWEIVSAAEVGAPHIRSRLWILANPMCIGRQKRARRSEQKRHEAWRKTDLVHLQKVWDREAATECERSVNEVAFRVERLRAIGNGQVPAVVREAWMRMMNE